MEKNNKTPKLRFSGYTDDWEQRKLGEITVESPEYATLETGLPLLTSSRSCHKSPHRAWMGIGCY